MLSPAVVFFGSWPRGPGIEVLLAFALTPITAGLVGPIVWPGLTRLRAVGCACTALLAWLPGLFIVFLIGFTLCSSDGTTIYISDGELQATVVLAVLAYLVLGSLAVLSTRLVAIAWPAATFTSLVITLALLAFVGDGPHYCYT